MQLRARLRRLKPLLLFFGLYTGLFLLLYATFSYTLPFLAGLLLALLTQPLCRWLRKRLRLPASGAAVLATLLVYAVLFGLLALLGAAVFREGQKLVGWIGELSPNRSTSYWRRCTRHWSARGHSGKPSRRGLPNRRSRHCPRLRRACWPSWATLCGSCFRG